ncbi:hypothetical protein DFH08DRAFT_868933 [Mycena albidolilacea]|uniref:Yippee domain-containing protein n=1 Tax=Mycena albidolilacea TaxID=1033008 RepID=A0AAD7ERE3_9AGAR|nr:hypothetical protein DFH08DRAFT_868933 [Mycena albidolilacea]
MPAQDAPLNSRRRLPTVPQPRARPLSRPLPPIPKPLSCKQCKTCITSYNAVLADIPPESRSFRGFSGKASLFTETYNVTLLPAKVQLMQTGAHLLAEITCTTCTAYLGYKILRAFEKTESWKESRFLLELAELENPYRPDAIGLDSSDSEDSS